MRERLRTICLVGLWLAVLALPALAVNKIVGITSNTPPVQVIGNTSLFVTIYNSTPGPLPVDFHWYYSCTNAGCSGSFADLGSTGASDQFTMTWEYPGKVNFKAIVTYDLDPVTMIQPPNTIAQTGPYVVNGPDTETITGGLNTVTAIDTSLPPSTFVNVTSVYSYGSTGIVTDASTIAEEKLEYVYPFVGTIDWSPGDPSLWTFMINTLTDSKAYLTTDTAAFDALNVGDRLAEHYQTNRLVILDCCSQTHYFQGPRRHYVRTKAAPPPSDPTGRYWVINEVTP